MPSAGVGILNQWSPAGIANVNAPRMRNLPIRKGLNNLRGLVFTKNTAGNEPTFQFLTKVTGVGTPLATGITVEFLVEDSVERPGAGLDAFFGISVKKLVSGTDTGSSTGFSTEVTQAVTLNATAGIVTVATKAIATADADAIAAGSWAIVQIRRLTDHASDTHTGDVILHGLAVTDTATP